MCILGYIVWVDVVILFCSLLGMITLGMSWKGMKKSSKRPSSLWLSHDHMGSLLCLSYIMQSETTGMMSTAAKTIAGIAGTAYPPQPLSSAPSAPSSPAQAWPNIMFAGMHMEAAAP